MLYFITAKSLYSLDMKKGAILEKSGLPHGHKFSGMSIDDETCLIAISSQKNCDTKSDVLMVFAIYVHYPSLLFQQLFEVCNLHYYIQIYLKSFLNFTFEIIYR